MNAHFKLVDDIDLTGMKFFVIGSEALPFAGTLDGNGKKIANFVWNYGVQWPFGLFVYVEGKNAEIRNLGLVDCNIDMEANGHCVGLLVGMLEEGTLTDCYVHGGRVQASSCIGGLIGSNGGAVTRCHSLARVEGDSHGIGGLIGGNSGNVVQCYSLCEVSGGQRLGGLIGGNSAFGRIHDCHSAGGVNGTRTVGGLVGHNDSAISEYGSLIAAGRIEECYSSASVTSDDDRVGGLVGSNHGTIIKCYATGSVVGIQHVGGLTGCNWSYGAVADCHAAGSVSGDGWLGGLVGYSTGAIINCHSSGSVSGATDVGGLVGQNDRHGAITSCLWDVQTSGMANMCGSQGENATGCDDSCGLTTAEMQTAGTFLEAGWDFINVWGIGENQTYPYLRKYSAADINQDGTVNFLDLCIIAEQWMEEQQ